MKTYSNLVENYEIQKAKIRILSIRKMNICECIESKQVDDYLKNISKERLEEIDKQLTDLEREVNKITLLIIKKVNSLKNQEIEEIILMRTLTSKTWKSIAKLCFYSEARVRQLYKKGIELLNN